MHEHAEPLLGLLSVDDGLEREFEARLAESSTLAFRVAFSVLRNRQDAEDVAQEAYVRAHQRFRQLRERDRFRAWLVRMTWRLAIDHLRSARRRLVREQFHATTLAPSVDEAASASERSAQLWAAIDALPEKLRLVVVLAAMDGYDIREVAQLLDLPEGTVKSRLFSARQKLKEHLNA
jgi:RNA polymerase sigma-70 factor, ECF subfamily